MKNRVLVNCANLHTGGGVAVASSFIDCVSKMSSREYDNLVINLLVSSNVDYNLRALNVNLARFESYEVKDFYGISSLWKGLGRKLNGYDAVFTIFGPAYTFSRIKNHFVGFAQPNIIYPDNHVYRQLSAFSKLRVRLKFFIQQFFFGMASSLVVELPHVKRGLLKRPILRSKRVEVVESAVHSVFLNESDWEPLAEAVMGSDDKKLGLVSRNYPHKNLKVLPDVKRILAEEFGMNVTFYVTFTEEEWGLCDEDFKNSVINVGPLRLPQCPSFYNRLDGVVFPTLLECFSAVPIETFLVGKPLFVSDRNFIRDICLEHANYFDPLEPQSIAISIKKFFSLPLEARKVVIDGAQKYVRSLPGADARARRYLELLRSELKG